jgi:leader peptidase (prepilin peptidase)/N-methyltransferase
MRDRFNDGERRENGLPPAAKARVTKIACGAAAVGGAIWVSVAVAPGMSGVMGAALAVISLAIAGVDYRQMIIPDELNASALLAGLVAAGLKSPTSPFNAIVEAVVRAITMFAVFFVFRSLYRRLRGVDGMGLGDVKLAAAAGAWLDWSQLPIAVDIAALSALAGALFARLGGREFTMTARVPFGLFLAPSIWLCWALFAWRDGPAS